MKLVPYLYVCPAFLPVEKGRSVPILFFLHRSFHFSGIIYIELPYVVNTSACSRHPYSNFHQPEERSIIKKWEDVLSMTHCVCLWLLIFPCRYGSSSR